jgi:hypothetical protein
VIGVGVEWGRPFCQDGKFARKPKTVLQVISITVPVFGHGMGGQWMHSIGKKEVLAGFF